MSGSSKMWYLARNKRKAGPFDLAQLQSMVEAGLVTPTDKILEVGTQTWVAAGMVAGLFAPPNAPLEGGAESSLAERVVVPKGQSRPPTKPASAARSASPAKPVAATHVRPHTPSMPAAGSPPKSPAQSVVPPTIPDDIQEIRTRRSGSRAKALAWLGAVIAVCLAALCIFLIVDKYRPTPVAQAPSTPVAQGRSQPVNDDRRSEPVKSSPVVAPKPDLRVSELTIKNGRLSAKIFNGGPTDYTRADGRQYVVSFPGGEGLFLAGAIPDLENGAEKTVHVRLADLVSAIKFDPAQKTKLTLALTPPDDQPDNDSMTTPYTPPGEAKVEARKVFESRLLLVKNETAEPVTVFLQLRADERDTSAWLPSVPPGQQPVPAATGGPALGLVTFSFELKPGEERPLKNQGMHISASRVRLFARSTSRSWDDHRNRDLWLVPEIDAGKHQYKAAARETFTCRLALPKGSVDTVPTPDADGPPAGASCTLFAVASMTSPALTTPVTQDIPIPELPVVSKPGTTAADADLEVSNFTIGPHGRFEATIINAGPSDYPGKRAWFLLGQDGTPFSEGDIPPLGMNDQVSVSGQIAGISAGAAYFLRLSPGDKNAGNDTAGLLFERTSKSDLAVSKVVVEEKDGVATLKAIITNNGPERYEGAAGQRTCSLGDDAGRMPSETRNVTDLDKGASTEVTMDVSKLAASNGVFFAKLSGSDADPTNDSGQYSFTAQGAGDADLEVSNVKIDGTKVRVTVTNNGPEDYKNSAGRTLKFNDEAPEVLPDIASKQSETYYFTLAALPTTKETCTAILSPGDKNPANDSLSKDYGPANAVVKTSKLDVTSLACDGTTLTAEVLNRGPDDLDTDQKIEFTAPGLTGAAPVEMSVPIPLAKGATISVTAPFSDIAGATPAPGVLITLQARPPSGGLSAFTTYTVPGTPIPAKSVDLAVDSPRYDSATDTFTAKFSHLGPDNEPVTPRIRVTAYLNGVRRWRRDATLSTLSSGDSIRFPSPSSSWATSLTKANIIANVGAVPGDWVTIAFKIYTPVWLNDPDPTNNRRTRRFLVGASTTAHRLEATSLTFDPGMRRLTWTVRNNGAGPYNGLPGWDYEITSSVSTTSSVVPRTGIPTPIQPGDDMTPNSAIVPTALVPTTVGTTVTYTLTAYDDAGAAQTPTATCTYTVPDVADLRALGDTAPGTPGDSIAFKVKNMSASANYTSGRTWEVWGEVTDPPTVPSPEFRIDSGGPIAALAAATDAKVFAKTDLRASYIATLTAPAGAKKFRFRLKLLPAGPNPSNDVYTDPTDYPVIVPHPPLTTSNNDLAVGDIQMVKGAPNDTVTVEIQNLGTCDYMAALGRTVSLLQNGSAVPGGARPITTTAAPTLFVGTNTTVSFNLGMQVGPHTLFTAVISPTTPGNPADHNSSNDTKSETLDGSKPGLASDVYILGGPTPFQPKAKAPSFVALGSLGFGIDCWVANNTLANVGFDVWYTPLHADGTVAGTGTLVDPGNTIPAKASAAGSPLPHQYLFFIGSLPPANTDPKFKIELRAKGTVLAELTSSR